MAPDVEQVISKLHSSSEDAQDLKSCDHSGPDCPHGDNVNQSNIPWASGTEKLTRTEGSNNTAEVDQPPRQKDSSAENASSSAENASDAGVKGTNMSSATVADAGKKNKI